MMGVATDKHVAKHTLVIEISKRKFFVLALLINGAFCTLMIAFIFNVAPSPYHWIPVLISMLIFVPIISVLQSVMASYMFRFEIDNGVMSRDFLLDYQRKSLADVTGVWKFLFVMNARTTLFERGFSLPGRVLLDAENRARLSSFAKENLKDTHPLYRLWADSSRDEKR